MVSNSFRLGEIYLFSRWKILFGTIILCMKQRMCLGMIANLKKARLRFHTIFMWHLCYFILEWINVVFNGIEKTVKSKFENTCEVLFFWSGYHGYGTCGISECLSPEIFCLMNHPFISQISFCLFSIYVVIFVESNLTLVHHVTLKLTFDNSVEQIVDACIQTTRWHVGVLNSCVWQKQATSVQDQQWVWYIAVGAPKMYEDTWP